MKPNAMPEEQIVDMVGNAADKAGGWFRYHAFAQAVIFSRDKQWEELLSKQEQDIELAYSAGLVEGERLAIEQAPQQEPVKLVDQHWSDCAVHNAPAYPKGECTCGVSASSLAPQPIIGLQAVHDAITANPSLAEEPGAAEEEAKFREKNQ